MGAQLTVPICILPVRGIQHSWWRSGPGWGNSSTTGSQRPRWQLLEILKPPIAPLIAILESAHSPQDHWTESSSHSRHSFIRNIHDIHDIHPIIYLYFISNTDDRRLIWFILNQLIIALK